MTQEGLEAIERAKKNGSWDNAKRILINVEQIEMLKEIIQPYEPA